MSPHAFGEVARDLEKPQQLAIRRTHGGDRNIRPDPTAVLPEPPAVIDKFSRRGSHFQLMFGKARALVLGRIESREVPPDDFMGGISLDSLGTTVPVENDAPGRHRENRVILDRFDELVEMAQLVTQALRGLGARARLVNVAHVVGGWIHAIRAREPLHAAYQIPPE